MIDQYPRGDHAYFSRWLANYRESRAEQSRPIKIVKA